jgi:hypothetical protein
MVQYYVLLRAKQFIRFYSFSDIHPLRGVPITLGLFTFVSALLYDKAPYPAWIYMVLSVAALTELQNEKTNSFLKQMTSRSTFFKIKLAENSLILLPFVLVMAYYHSWLQLIIAIALVIPYSYSSAKLPKPKLKALKTPYAGYAYEGNFGFRSMFFAYVLYAALLIVGCAVHNIYVFMVPFFILLFCMQAVYGEIEEPIYIWMYRTSAGGFLKKKLSVLFRNYLITFAPFLLLGLVFYYAEWPLLLLCFMAGLLANIGSMLIKYHFYPGRMIVQISQMVFFGCTVACLAMPVMLFAVVLFLLFSAYRARTNLKYILKC